MSVFDYVSKEAGSCNLLSTYSKKLSDLLLDFKYDVIVCCGFSTNVLCRVIEYVPTETCLIFIQPMYRSINVTVSGSYVVRLFYTLMQLLEWKLLKVDKSKLFKVNIFVRLIKEIIYDKFSLVGEYDNEMFLIVGEADEFVNSWNITHFMQRFDKHMCYKIDGRHSIINSNFQEVVDILEDILGGIQDNA